MEGILTELGGRRARRGIASDPLPDAMIQRLVEAARIAPSCFNNQPWRIAVAGVDPLLGALRDSLSTGNAWAKAAPLLVAVLTKPSLDCRLDGGRDYAAFDCGLAAMSLMVQAQHEGLIAHPMAGFNPDMVRKALGAGADWTPWVLIAVGSPGVADDLEPWQREREEGARQRKPAAETVAVNGWSFG